MYGHNLSCQCKYICLTLRELEENHLVHRKVYPEVPPKVEYSLTDTSMELTHIIDHLGAWGEKQMEKGNQSKRHPDQFSNAFSSLLVNVITREDIGLYYDKILSFYTLNIIQLQEFLITK